MEGSVSPFTLFVFGSGLLAIVVAIGALRHRPDPMAVPLATLMVLAAAWAIPHAISMSLTDPAQVRLWNRIRFPGTLLAPIAYLFLTLKYAGYERWLSRRVYAAVLFFPLVTLVVVWTNGYHGLYWQSVSVVRMGGASIVDPVGGPWYLANLAYLYLAVVGALFVLGITVVQAGPIYRKQAGLMFVGGLGPLVTNVIVNFGFADGSMIDFTTTALAITGLTFALALFHFDLLNIRPVARDRLVEELEDGVVVVGPNGRVRDFNRTAAEVLEDIAIEEPAERWFASDIAPDGGELITELDGRTRVFRTRATILTDGRGRKSGRIVYLNDVTELVEREQRISVLNRILRHNIRNDLNVVGGHLDDLSERAAAEDRERIEEAREHVHRVTAFADKARDIERTIQDPDATTTASATAIAGRAAREARERYPDATVEYAPPDGPVSARVVDEALLERAIRELLENGIVHSERNDPTVTARIERDADTVRIHVADDGPGIPPVERRVLESRSETSLEHGSGLGLWLVQWTASLSEGSLSFDVCEDGSVVTLSLPAVGNDSDGDDDPTQSAND